MKLTLKGRPITKKNSQQIVLTKTGRRYVIQSKQYIAYEKDCLWQIKAQYKNFDRVDRLNIDIKNRYHIRALYYMPTKFRPDLLNLEEATADILEKAGIIDNDKNIESWDGSRISGIDKANPRTEITIEGRG